MLSTLRLCLLWRLVSGIGDGFCGIAATCFSVLGLGQLLGNPGIGLAAVLLVLVGNPLSGLATGPEMLPPPWGTIGQLLPPGATGTLMRSNA